MAVVSDAPSLYDAFERPRVRGRTSGVDRMVVPRLTTLGLLLVLGCESTAPPRGGSSARARGARGAAFLQKDASGWSTEVLGEEKFFREVVDYRPLPTSGSFDAYGFEPYGVDKVAFWKRFPGYAEHVGTNLEGFVILGPRGGLWTYWVCGFFRAGLGMRVNCVVFAHSRLTYKATGVLSAASSSAWFRRFGELESARAVSPNPDRIENSLPQDGRGDYRFEMLVVRTSTRGAAFITGPPELLPTQPAPHVVLFGELFGELEATYRHGDPIPSAWPPPQDYQEALPAHRANP